MFKFKTVYSLNVLYIESIHDGLTDKEFVKRTIDSSYSKMKIIEKLIVGKCLKTYLRICGRPSTGFYVFKVEADEDANIPNDLSLTRVDF